MNDDRTARYDWVLVGVLGVSLIVNVVLAVAVLRTSTRQSPGNNSRNPSTAIAIPKEPVSLNGAAAHGTRTAHVAIIEYSDFQCPFCGQFARDTLPAITRKYVDSGQVLMAFRHRPLAGIHPFAVKASEAAECANRQGKFWEMHDRLFANQLELGEASLFARAHDIGLDEAEFRSCLDGQASGQLKQDEAAGNALSITGTPAFLIGTLQKDGRVKASQWLIGAQPLSRFEGVLDPLVVGIEAGIHNR